MMSRLLRSGHQFRACSGQRKITRPTREPIEKCLGEQAEIPHRREDTSTAGHPTHTARCWIMHGAAKEVVDIGVESRGVLVARSWCDSGQEIGAPSTCRTVAEPRRGWIDRNCGTDDLVWSA